MEDIKAYIESGILELYVLGDLSPEERLQVEGMALKHLEVKAELGAIEASLEVYARAHAVDPSEKMQDRVLNSLLINFGNDESFPGRTVNRVIEMPARTPSNFYKYAFAACLVLLLVSIAALINVYNKWKQSDSQVVALQLEKQQFSKRVNLMDEQLDVFRDSTFRFVKLKGTPKTPASAMTVAWSPVKKKVMIDMAGMKLPANDESHQYQLWAIVKGKPVDLGVFDAKADTAMKEMKPVEQPQAFAVTLEPRGGSANPTMDEMVVISNI
ncbi:anti-sigma factor [Mucilaginibacter limnophilus]|uniref:Anti-sigma factor n=1 Tax=Mucilaginibacter limnophilus TaxID=1932778 RepID=A0A437MLI5_9SPHI|nr:anti-sigma factor [Mucilaginibacter limnophilus]RVT98511.1 anti-sigma factor [Mucilaginibacter limnophilus]